MAEVDGRVLFCVYVWRGEMRRVISLRVGEAERTSCLPRSNCKKLIGS